MSPWPYVHYAHTMGLFSDWNLSGENLLYCEGKRFLVEVCSFFSLLGDCGSCFFKMADAAQIQELKDIANKLRIDSINATNAGGSG